MVGESCNIICLLQKPFELRRRANRGQQLPWGASGSKTEFKILNHLFIPWRVCVCNVSLLSGCLASTITRCCGDCQCPTAPAQCECVSISERCVLIKVKLIYMEIWDPFCSLCGCVSWSRAQAPVFLSLIYFSSIPVVPSECITAFFFINPLLWQPCSLCCSQVHTRNESLWSSVLCRCHLNEWA